MPLCITLNQNVVAFSFYAKMLHEKLHKNYKYVFPPLNLTCSFRCFNSIFDDPLISEWQYLFSYKISANDLQRSFLNSFTQFIVQWNPYLNIYESSIHHGQLQYLEKNILYSILIPSYTLILLLLAIFSDVAFTEHLIIHMFVPSFWNQQNNSV